MIYFHRPSFAQIKFIPFLLLVLGNLAFSQPAYASASLAISSATLGSNGTTITVNISGVTGSLSPATGITGLTINSPVGGNSAIFPATTTVSSGSTVTISLLTPIRSGAATTITLAVSPTSNLTDTGGDTPSASGNTGVSVTNNSTQTATDFSLPNTNIFITGTPADNGAAYAIGAAAQQVSFNIHASSVSSQMYGGTWLITVDGATSTISVPCNWTETQLFSGLSDSVHTVAMVPTASSCGGFSNVYKAGFVTAQGASPSVSLPSGFGYGPVLIPTSVGKQPFGFIGTWTQDNLDGGVFNMFDPDNYGAYSFNYGYNDTRMKFKATASTLKLYSYLNGSSVDLYTDGVLTSTILLPNSDSYAWATLSTSLDGANEHEYEVAYVHSGLGTPVGFYPWAFMVNPGGSFDTSATFTPPTTYITGFGDSITASGDTGATLTSKDGFMYRIGQATGVAVNNLGIGGSTVINTTANSGVNSARINDILALPPSTLFIMYGYNDMHGSLSTSTFQSSFQTMMQGIVSGTSTYAGLTTATTKHIVVMGLMQSGISTSTAVAYDTGMTNAIAALTVSSTTPPITYINTYNTFWPSNLILGDTAADGIHPTYQGYTKMVNHLLPFAAATGYTVAGPSSGIGTATSTNFTVTIASGAAFTGDQTVTVSDGGNGGTFTPSVGTASSSSITVTPTASTTSFTFTYAPASTGTKTLTFSNGQNWSDPSFTTYAANSTPQPATTSITAPSNGPPVGSFAPGTIITGPFFVGAVAPQPKATAASQAQTLTPSPQSATRTFPFAKNYQLYDVGADVRALQQFLNDHGFEVATFGPGSPGHETLFFGLKTYRALVEFQSANNLPPTGFFGPLTRSTINRIDQTATSSPSAQ